MSFILAHQLLISSIYPIPNFIKQNSIYFMQFIFGLQILRHIKNMEPQQTSKQRQQKNQEQQQNQQNEQNGQQGQQQNNQQDNEGNEGDDNNQEQQGEENQGGQQENQQEGQAQQEEGEQNEQEGEQKQQGEEDDQMVNQGENQEQNVQQPKNVQNVETNKKNDVQQSHKIDEQKPAPQNTIINQQNQNKNQNQKAPVVTHSQVHQQPKHEPKHPHPIRKQLSHRNKPQQHAAPSITVTELQKQKYINNLQNNLQLKQKQITLLNNKSKMQLDKISSLEGLKISLDTNLNEKLKQVAELTHKYKLLQVQTQHSKTKIKQLQQQLVSYREVGDIKILLTKVEELESLVKAQTQQIKLIKQGDKDQIMNQRSPILSKQYIENVQKLKNQKEQLQASINQLRMIVHKKNIQTNESTIIMNDMDTTIKNNIEKIQLLEEQLRNQKTDRHNQKNNYENKIKDMQNYIKANSSKLSMNQEEYQQKQRQQKQKQDKTLLIQKQKDIVFREYLKLQIEHKNLQQNIKQFNNKYVTVAKQLRNVKKQMVSKKDYQQIILKYKKCKSCLQKAIKQNKILRSQGSDLINNENGQFQGRIGSSILNQEEQNMRKYLQVFNHHIQQSIGLFKQTNNIMENDHIYKLNKQIEKNKQLILQIEQKNHKLETLNNIFQRELQYKNVLMQRLIEDLKQVRSSFYKLQKEKIQIQQNLSENITAKNALQRLQAKSANLINRNRVILAQKQNWKTLYEQLKIQYQSFIARDPNLQNKNIQEQTQMKTNNKKNVEEGQIQEEQQQQIKTKKVSQKKKEYHSSQTQTQGLNQLYFKQIKETLSALKKVPQTMKNGVTNIEKIKTQLQDYKKKYEQINNKFNIKFKTLQTEKNQNETWRENARKQIISQYQDIRQLIQNNRLIDCLRKAKNLIQGLQQPQEEQGQVIS